MTSRAAGGFRPLLAIVLLLSFACTAPPVRESLELDFTSDDDSVVVTAETALDLDAPGTAAAERVRAAQAALETGIDPWSVRFQRIEPGADRTTIDRVGGRVQRVTRSARIAPEQIQQLLADANVTVSVQRGDGWRELSLYTGTSRRGSREQQRHFDEELERWSRDVARYFQAVHRLYAYLDDQPQRAKYVFAAILNEKGVDGAAPAVTEDEEGFVTGVVDAMEAIGNRLDEQSERATTFAEEADLLFNPLPARLTVRVATDILSSQGFENPEQHLVIVEPVDLIATIAQLEGRWISPDPLAALLREEPPTAEELAEAPRRSEAVISAGEIAAAIRERLARSRTYVVRWRD